MGLMDFQLLAAFAIVALAIPYAWHLIRAGWKTGDANHHCDHCPANPENDSPDLKGRF